MRVLIAKKTIKNASGGSNFDANVSTFSSGVNVVVNFVTQNCTGNLNVSPDSTDCANYSQCANFDTSCSVANFEFGSNMQIRIVSSSDYPSRVGETINLNGLYTTSNGVLTVYFP